MNEIKKTIKETFLETYNSKVFQITIDLSRIFLVFFALLIFFELINNIEQVKILGNDPCRLCENKTGGRCIYYNETAEIIHYKIPIINWSGIVNVSK